MVNYNRRWWSGIIVADQKITFDAPEGALYWFSEGFTEYYANTLNFKNNFFTVNDYVENINQILYEYFTSPVHHARNEQITSEFWENRAVEQLPYVRGCMLALHWNKKIKKATNTQCCLDDFMLALFKKAKESKRPLSEEDLHQTMSLFLPREVVDEDVRRYITNGETLNPENDDLGDLCTLEWTENIGFNTYHAQSKGTVEGVQKGSAADKAGLVNGQLFQRYNLADGTVSVVVGQQLLPKGRSL